jgi:hypothetical protein
MVNLLAPREFSGAFLRGSALARRGWFVGTNILDLLVAQVSSAGEECEQVSEDNPNVDPHKQPRRSAPKFTLSINAVLSREHSPLHC